MFGCLEYSVDDVVNVIECGVSEVDFVVVVFEQLVWVFDQVNEVVNDVNEIIYQIVVVIEE